VNLSTFIAMQRNNLALFEAHCIEHGITAAPDSEAWYQALAEFFEDGAPR
jgi:hypothetical protein